MRVGRPTRVEMSRVMSRSRRRGRSVGGIRGEEAECEEDSERLIGGK